MQHSFCDVCITEISRKTASSDKSARLCHLLVAHSESDLQCVQVLGGSAGGKIRSATERLGLVSAISALSYADPQAAGNCAPSAIDFLCTYYK